jgi:GNAT superfamily N-acetyltransferase
MSHPELQFQPLTTPPTSKVLTAWRKDAGWSAPVRPNTLQHPRAIVRWVSVMAGNERAGIARLELAAPEFCYVADLIIAAKFRHRGIGSWFLDAIEKYASGQGIKRLVLQAEAGSEQFYQSHHFISDPLVPSFLKKELSPLLRKLFLPR